MLGAQTGAVSLRIGGEPRRIVFTWGALARLREEYGREFDEKMNSALSEFDLPVIAHILAAGLGGAWTGEAVMCASPPIVESVRAVAEAIRIAYHGPDKASEVAARPLRMAAHRIGRLILSIRRLLNGWASAAIGRRFSI